MKYSSQLYLDCYTKLHSQQSSKESNKILLQIESSDEAWKIAQELMMQPTYNVHGSQLLSKKLNSTLPLQVNPQVLAQFILSIEPISNIHWLCIAKIFVHTHQNSHQLSIEGNLSLNAKLNILKQIPYALGQMAHYNGIKDQIYITELYKQNLNLIFQGIQFCLQNKIQAHFDVQKIEDLILQALQSFSQHKVSLKNPTIAQFILGLSQLDKSSNLLEYIFLEEQYPELEDKIQKFLNENVNSSQKEWVKTFYLNFYAKKNIFQNFSLEKYEKVLTTATLMMKTDDDEEFRTLLMDSFDFWINVINNLSDKQNRTEKPEVIFQKEKLLKKSLFFIFQSLCKHSRLKKCPNTIRNIESNLDIIDLDSEEGIISSSMGTNLNDQYSELNYNALQIRDLSIDLFVKIQEGLKTDPQLYKKMFETFYILVTGKEDSQNIELVVFFIDGMTDFCDEQSIPYLSELIKMILSQKQKLNEYICQKIVIMLGKIDKIIVSNLSMLPLVFQFFSNTIMYNKLSSLASESFTELMDQYEVKNLETDLQFKKKSQSYLNFWFQNFYGKLKNEKVLQNITKALIIFIYKFKGEQFYGKFLLMMKEKICSTDDQLLKQIYLQAVITGQNWINSRQDNKNHGYLIIFADFVTQFVELLVENCFKVNRKSDFTKAVSKINWALKAGCYFTKIDFWLSAIKQIIEKAMFGSQQQILPVALTPIITLLKSQIMTIDHKKSLLISIGQVIQPITDLFVKYHENKTTIDYNFSKYILQIHNLTISLILFTTEFSGNTLLNYDPSVLFKFVRQKIYKNKTFWEYEVYKEALIFMNQLVNSDYEIQIICEEILRVCPRTLQSLWIQTENILLNIYKKQNLVPFLKSFNLIKPEILPPNPLFSILVEGLEKSDRKALKSFVRCL